MAFFGKAVKKELSRAQLINQDSGNFEYFTPEKFTESAHKLMGGIDLDPASCLKANQRVKASHFFTKHDDGLTKPWFGRVWMNHPFSKGEMPCAKLKSGEYSCGKSICAKRGYHIDIEQPGNKHWINKIVDEYENGEVTEAINICFGSTGEPWFRPLLKYPQCFIYGRVNYFDENGVEVKGCTKSSVITYFGNNLEGFKKEFSQYGAIK